VLSLNGCWRTGRWWRCGLRRQASRAAAGTDGSTRLCVDERVGVFGLRGRKPLRVKHRALHSGDDVAQERRQPLAVDVVHELAVEVLNVAFNSCYEHWDRGRRRRRAGAEWHSGAAAPAAASARHRLRERTEFATRLCHPSTTGASGPSTRPLWGADRA